VGNVFLDGNFAPVREEWTATDLAVTGHIPEFLDGRYLRNGPNPAGEVDPEAYHWFTGDGMVHGIRIRDGRAEWYRNRWVRSPGMAALLGEPYRGKRSSAPFPGFGANTNVIGHAGRILALVEAGTANYELNGELDTVGACDFDGTLPGGFTAHPQRDPDTGELHAISYYFGWGNRVQYSVIDAAGRARRTVDIKVTGSPMMHNFSLTKSHVLIYDLPVTFDARQAVKATVPALLRAPARLVLSALVGRVRIPSPPVSASSRPPASAGFPYRWNPRYPARIGVMPPHGPTEGEPALLRWIVGLAAGKVREEQLDDRPQEFPRIDERRVGRRHRYGYAPLFMDGPHALLKHDLERRTGGNRPTDRLARSEAALARATASSTVTKTTVRGQPPRA
jgi:carotenoid cleavage dioxygenase